MVYLNNTKLKVINTGSELDFVMYCENCPYLFCRLKKDKTKKYRSIKLTGTVHFLCSLSQYKQIVEVRLCDIEDFKSIKIPDWCLLEDSTERDKILFLC